MRMLYLIPICIFLLLWEIVAQLYSMPNFLPTPIKVVIAIKELAFSPGPAGLEWAGELLGNTLISLFRIITGFCIAALIGIPFGIIVGWQKSVRELITPIVEIIRPIPPLALIPLAILWFGLGSSPAIFLIFLGSFFPIFSNTILGVKNTSRVLIDVAKTLGAKEKTLLVKVVLPSAMPSIIAGLKVGLGIGWMCLIAAELTGTNSGLGFMIIYYYWTMEAAKTIAGMLVISLIGIVTYALFEKFEDTVLSWRETVV